MVEVFLQSYLSGLHNFALSLFSRPGLSPIIEYRERAGAQLHRHYSDYLVELEEHAKSAEVLRTILSVCIAKTEYFTDAIWLKSQAGQVAPHHVAAPGYGSRRCASISFR